jgi:hypothetical protein
LLWLPLRFESRGGGGQTPAQTIKKGVTRFLGENRAAPSTRQQRVKEDMPSRQAQISLRTWPGGRRNEGQSHWLLPALATTTIPNSGWFAQSRFQCACFLSMPQSRAAKGSPPHVRIAIRLLSTLMLIQWRLESASATGTDSTVLATALFHGGHSRFGLSL